ncbi:methyltransferase [candidate division WOR_3 bacterium SM23_42]|uniref:Methyltransferase n=1 Tax=candidate division WOR_3 bacterium SM23_42 TaxID=1703779 RepID=A0A0S8FVA2_UNCW3|nr:MAG: methyltransferase [candidate division WOR_3 bacterium SM23_42]
MDLLRRISEALQTGSIEKVATLTKQAIEEKVVPRDILDKGLIAGMSVIGDRYKKHEIFLPEVLLAAKAMYAGMDILKPMFLKDEMPTLGRVVIGTVQGDIHDIGKNLVGIMLRGAGFRVIDLGKDVPPERFIEVAKKENAEVIGMSALLTTTMPAMKKVIELVKKEGLNGKVKTIIGGAPVSAEYAQHIGADAYAYDSINAVDCIRGLVQKP